VIRSNPAHDAPWSHRGLSARGSALVQLGDPRDAEAARLILQELGLNVDLAADGDAAVHWARHGRYEVIALGGPIDLAVRIRAATGDPRVIMLLDGAEPVPPPDALAALDIEALGPPAEVNALMRALWPAA